MLNRFKYPKSNEFVNVGNKSGFPLEMKVSLFLDSKGFNPEYGARPVKRVIQKEVLNALSKEILSGKVTTDSIILLDAFDDQLVFRNEASFVSEEF